MTGNLLGQTLANRYRFDRLVGQGTFAHVYQIYDLNRRAVLAAKVLRSDIAHDPTLVERFRREARALERLQHPHIVRYYDILDIDALIFILMDYIPGETLQTALYKRTAPIPVRSSLAILNPLAAALYYAHSENIIHRDLKPGNILLHENGTLYVSDFGIARFLSDVSTLTLGATIGTPLYMSPEQITGQPVTSASDLYSLGVILYQMYTGDVPFIGESPDAEGSTAGERVAYEHVHIDPKPPTEVNPALDPAVEEVILRCLNKEPDRRFSSVAVLYDALTEAIGAPPTPLESEVNPALPPNINLPEWSQVLDPVPSDSALDYAPPRDEEDTDDLPDIPAELPPTRPHLEEALKRERQRASQPTIPGMRRVEQFEAPTLPPQMPPQSMPALSAARGRLLPTGRVPTSGRRFRLPYLLLAGGVMTVSVLLCVGLVLVATWWMDSNDAEREVGQTTLEPALTLPSTNGASPGGTDTGGSRVAFDSRRDGSLALYVMNVDGSNLRKIETDLPAARGPSWSPDRTQLAFYGTPAGDSAYDIFTINLDGTGLRNLTNSADINDRYPTWSPDGSQIAFHSNLDGDNEIYIINRDGTDRRQLTDNIADDLGPDWSPDGRHIAYHTDVWGSPYEIAVIDIQTQESRRLTDTDDINSFATWSPDGTRLAFHVINTVDLAVNIYIMQADGSNLRAITNTPERDAFPDWSPYGTELIYQNGLEGISGIFILPLDGQEPRAITGRQMNYLPEWEPLAN